MNTTQICLMKVRKSMLREELLADLLLSKMGQFIQVNGSIRFETGLDHKCGRMDPGTRGTGRMIRLTVRANWCTLMAIFTKASGLTTKPMEKVHIPMLTELTIMVTG